jgi:hypothetical protein
MDHRVKPGDDDRNGYGGHARATVHRSSTSEGGSDEAIPFSFTGEMACVREPVIGRASRRLLSQLPLMRFDELEHAAELEVDVRKFSGMHGGAESFLRVPSVDPA